MSSELFDELRKSIKEAGKIRKGRAKPSRRFTYDAIDIRKLRESLGVSQSQFARMIGVSVDTAQNWEQGRRRPRGPAMALLRVFEKNPKAVVDALTGSPGKAGATVATSFKDPAADSPESAPPPHCSSRTSESAPCPY